MGWPVTIPPEQRPAVARSTIARYLDGERLEDMAVEHGVTRARLNQILLETAEEEWRSAQVAAAVQRLEDSEKELVVATGEVKSASDMLAITRARESAVIAEKAAKLAQWKLERLCRRLFGTDAPPTGQGTVQININLTSGQAETEIKQVSEE